MFRKINILTISQNENNILLWKHLKWMFRKINILTISQNENIQKWPKMAQTNML